MAEFLAAPLSNAAEVAALATLDAGLGYLFDEFQIPAPVQAKVASLGYTSLHLFASMEDTSANLRAAIATDLGTPSCV